MVTFQKKSELGVFHESLVHTKARSALTTISG